jgi:hypothetical protein
MIYDEIYNFCKVRNHGNCYSNGNIEPTPRVKFLLELLDKEGIKYELDAFPIEDRWTSWFDDEDYYKWRKKIKKKNIKKWPGLFDWDDEFFDIYDEPEGAEVMDDVVNSATDIDIREVETKKSNEPKKPKNILYNIILRGTSNRMVIAHHDVQNATIDNANDNSCSVINAIAVKKLRPDTHVVLVDGEECGGLGSDRLGVQIKEGKFGNIEWVLNFELTGKGGKNFFVGNYPGSLTNKIIELFDPPVSHTPFNDAIPLRRHGIDSTVINPLPILPPGKTSSIKTKDGHFLDYEMLHHCHNTKDNVASIDPRDMKEFVEDIVVKIIDS